MRRTLYFVMALALVLGFTQCKKEQVNTPENETKTVNITLNVGGNGGGSRHDINTTTGAVDFKNGDVIYVGDGSTYIGTLTHNGTNFSGPINQPTDGTEIYFFFVGGLTTTPADLSGQSSFTVDISDQSAKMPVLSCNHVTYSSGTTSYSCVLQNQCALVKFTTASTTDPVHVGGLYTEAKIDFDNNSITNNGTKGFVALNSTSETEKWAVLLPQTGFVGAEAAIARVGYTTTIPTIEADAFITGEDAVSISTQSNIVYLDWLTSNYTATDGQTLKGTLAGNYQISIAYGVTVTLDGVSINAEGTWKSGNYAGITCLGNATLILKDGSTNTVKGFNWNYPGIYVPDVPEGSTLIIKGGAAGTGKLTASSNGYGAGIGGGYDEGDYEISCGNIEIQGGDITATGGEQAAGIGSGCYANCGTITITGGTVTATGGSNAAGIGGGSDFASCGTITISGGTVTATGGEHAAGIGSGTTGASCGAITITTGVTQVTATKGKYAPNSIGAGDGGSCGTVTIGGVVYWDGSAYQNGGATYLTTSSLVYPTPAPVEQIVDLSTITSAYTAVDGDILTGTLGTGVQISIANDATITLRSANINGSDNLSGTFHGLNCLGNATIILENNNNVVKAKCSSGGRAGIFVPQHKTLTFEAGNSSGFVAATGAGEAAGIGGYSNTNCGAIVINSGKVTGTAGSGVDELWEDSYSAGIGSSAYKRCDGITINGGQVIGTAYADGNAAGIGTGGNGICKKDGDSDGSQPAITISNTLSNYVKAQKGSNATYFIGGASSSDKCGIVIVGGTTYEDGDGNRGISSSTSLSYDFTVTGNTLIYQP